MSRVRVSNAPDGWVDQGGCTPYVIRGWVGGTIVQGQSKDASPVVSRNRKRTEKDIARERAYYQANRATILAKKREYKRRLRGEASGMTDRAEQDLRVGEALGYLDEPPPPEPDDREPAKCRRHRWVEDMTIGSIATVYRCARCSKRRNEAIVRRNRANRQRGGAFERTVAKRYGGRKTGPLGGRDDVMVGSLFAIQTKRSLRLSLNEARTYLDDLARIFPGRTPVVIHALPGERGGVVIWRLNDHVAMHGKDAIEESPVPTRVLGDVLMTTDTRPSPLIEAANDVRERHQSNDWPDAACVADGELWPCAAELLAELVITRASLEERRSTLGEPGRDRARENAALEAGTHVPAVDDFGNQYLSPSKDSPRDELREAAQEVWDSVPATFDKDDPMVQRHARALNALRAALEDADR